MLTIEKLVNDLNGLYRFYLIEKTNFNDWDKLRAVVMGIKKLGYKIVSPMPVLTLPKYECLSCQGKLDHSKMIEVKKLRMKATIRHDHIQAGYWGELELRIITKIKQDFLNDNKNQPFIISGRCSNMILYNDPDNFLFILFKK